MAIILKLNEEEFIENFFRDDFSREALVELFNYYDELSEDIGEDLNLDVVAICCEWQEMDEEEILNQYGESEDFIEDVLDYLRDNTKIIEVEGGTWLVREF